MLRQQAISVANSHAIRHQCSVWVFLMKGKKQEEYEWTDKYPWLDPEFNQNYSICIRMDWFKLQENVSFPEQ